MRLLWLNWRDIKNPEAGGAEVFTHEIMRRLVAKGYDATLFSASCPNCTANEIIDGVKIVRSGGKYSVYRDAKRFYRNNNSSFDLVIDEINTRPFLTPLYVKDKPIIAIVHQLARDFWFYETPFPLNYLGYHYLEKKWLSNYRMIPVVTVSRSTEMDLEELGFQNIHVVAEGLNISPLPEIIQKELVPTLIFVGRLKKAKLPHHALHAFTKIKELIPDAKMWIVGDGYMASEMKKMCIQDVTFFGRVSNEVKYDLMKRAHLMLVPAVREGWGLVVTESNAMGTPVIAYDVHGLRDSVKDGETGILVPNSPVSMAEAAISLLNDTSRLKRLSENALEDSRSYSWDKTADEFDRVIRTLANYTSYL